jgi:hypothetical protein
MVRYALGVLCLFCVFVSSSKGQTLSSIEPVHAAAGTVLTFHLQTRLSPGGGNEFDALPKGTTLRVKMLDSIDSHVDHDGAAFRGTVVSAVTSGNETVVHPDAEVRGILVLLRSRSHPEGFRFELLVTGLTDRGKSSDLTASLNPSFFETAPAPAAPVTNVVPPEKPKDGLSDGAKLTEHPSN